MKAHIGIDILSVPLQLIISDRVAEIEVNIARPNKMCNGIKKAALYILDNISVPIIEIIKLIENIAIDPCKDFLSFQITKCLQDFSPMKAANGSAKVRIHIDMMQVMGFSQNKAARIKTDKGK